MNFNNETVLPFNNQIETGLRILTILDRWFPIELDITTLLYLDYIVVHSGDIDSNVSSLHVSVPYRRGELLVRKPLIQSGINLLVAKGLVNIAYLSNGLHYKATENSSPFIDSLSTEYSTLLLARTSWAFHNFKDLSSSEIHGYLSEIEPLTNTYFNLEILD